VHFAITISVRFVLLVVALSCASCQRTIPAPPLFELVAPRTSGVTFVNELPEDTAFNILSYLYYYNGGGVAAGDINNDGLPDLYFSSNLGSDRLYLNKRQLPIRVRHGALGRPRARRVDERRHDGRRETPTDTSTSTSRP
jgi:hypothetical protein